MKLFFTILFFANLLLSKAGLQESAALFRQKTHLNPPKAGPDPYLNTPSPATSQTSVCAILYKENKKSYETKSYLNKDAAKRDNAIITHFGPCGTCSSLQDLAVYLEKPDLTKPGKKCAMLSWLKSASILCFKKIGFSEPCAHTWFYNARNTAKKCFWTCMGSFLINEASNLPDGSLNKCLQCDETESGPLFKQSAGRTRRNSGLISSIKRSDEEVADIEHDYY
jgi:hypothetical protein